MDRVLVSWPDQMSFLSDYQSNLQRNGLMIPILHPWGIYAPLLLTLEHPSGERLHLRARVVATIGDEVALDVELWGSDRAVVQGWTCA